MREVELFTGLLVAVVLLALVAYRVRGIPHAVALVVGGVAIGALPFAPDIQIEPDLILLVFLPPILYPSAYEFAFESVRGNLRPIGFLAIGLVLATMAAIAVALHLVADVAWAPAFVIGAVLAPTDPVAATSVIRSTGAPSRLATILEGESLVNDGTALTVLRIAIGTVGGSFALGPAIGEFVLVALSGAAIGAALGWATARLLRRVDAVELEAAITVLLAFGAFVLAEVIHVSGVLATVAAGFVMGRATDVSSPATRIGGGSFWGVAQFLAESMLFLLVGLAFGQVVADPATRPALELAGITALVVVVAVGTRLAWIFSLPYAARLLYPTRQRLGPLIGARERLVLGFGGLRGAVSVAAALSIPASVAGADFPERNTLIAVSFAAIVVLLVGPALLLGPLVRALGLAGQEDLEEREREARAALAEAALSRAEQAAAERQVPEHVLEHVRRRYELRIERFARDEDEAQREDLDASRGALRDLWSETLDAQRRELDELRRRGEISGELLLTLQRDLDLDEARIR